MTYRNEPSADEIDAAALAGMTDRDKRAWKFLRGMQRSARRRRSKHGPEEDRMVRGPIEDRGRKRGRRG